MKVKDLFNILENTNFCYEILLDINSKTWDLRETKLSEFGTSSYFGGWHKDIFVFEIIREIDGQVYTAKKSFDAYAWIEAKILDYELVDVVKIELAGYAKEASSGNTYFGNTCSMLLKVKEN